VAPAGFAGPFHGLAGHLWVPLAMREQLHVGEDLAVRNHVWLELIGRLAPGVGRDEAQAAVDLAVTHLGARLPADWGVAGVDLRPLSPVPAQVRGPVTAFLGLLQALTGLLLLVAGINVAGMLVARAGARRKEIAIRLSLGSTRRRLARQMLVESLVLFLVAALLGLGLTYLAIDLAPRLLAPTLATLSLPVEIDLRLDHRVLAFTLLVALVAGTVFGFAPLGQAARPAVLPALQDGAGGTTGVRQARLRSALVVAQIAVSLLLLVIAGLLALSLRRNTLVDPGFDPEGVEVMALDLSRHGYDDAGGQDFYRRLVERVEGLPGVRGVALTTTLPLGFERRSTAVSAHGRAASMGTDLTGVSPGYFRLMGIPLVAGRDFTPADRAGSVPVVIVNRELAHRFWPGGEAVGQTLFDGDPATGEPLRVVGVAATTKVGSLAEEPSPFLYRPLAQDYRPGVTLLARLDAPPDAVVPAIRRAVRALDDGLPVVDPRPLAGAVGLSLLPLKIATGLAGGLGVVGLVLVAVGLYALTAFLAQQRVREVGIRLALGAQARDVVRLMMRRGVILTAVGLAVGLVLAGLAGWALSRVLFGVGASGAVVLAALAALLGGVSLTASYLPARRSARLEPLRAVRHP
jgi:predicted permease